MLSDTAWTFVSAYSSQLGCVDDTHRNALWNELESVPLTERKKRDSSGLFKLEKVGFERWHGDSVLLKEMKRVRTIYIWHQLSSFS